MSTRARRRSFGPPFASTLRAAQAWFPDYRMKAVHLRGTRLRLECASDVLDLQRPDGVRVGSDPTVLVPANAKERHISGGPSRTPRKSAATPVAIISAQHLGARGFSR